MKKKEFAKKYDGAIRSVAIANNVDMGVARDMLIYEAKVAAGYIKREDTYKGVPAGTDLKEVFADWKSITD